MRPAREIYSLHPQIASPKSLAVVPQLGIVLSSLVESVVDFVDRVIPLSPSLPLLPFKSRSFKNLRRSFGRCCLCMNIRPTPPRPSPRGNPARGDEGSRFTPHRLPWGRQTHPRRSFSRMGRGSHRCVARTLRPLDRRGTHSM